MRDDFSRKDLRILADRVGNKCSNPYCRLPTSGPDTDPKAVVNIGVAAHITAASPGGPRYDPTMAPKERKSISNAIWLCQNHAKLVDDDESWYTVDRLKDWKKQSENEVRALLSASTYRSLSTGEIRVKYSPVEDIAFRRLELEFGCPIKRDIGIPAGDHCINLDGAVVDGEELVGIWLSEFKGRGFPFFQVEYMIELGHKTKFDRFRTFSLYVVVISDAEPSKDRRVEEKLIQLASQAPITVIIRMYRLNPTRARLEL